MAKPLLRTITVPAVQYRAATVSGGRMSISSDTPCLRYDWYSDERYWEVLDHSRGGFDETRLKGGLPLLYNHNPNQHLGRAGGFDCDGHKIDCADHVWSGDDFAQAKKKDMEAGVLVDTSVAYTITDDGVCVGEKDGYPIYKFKWEPYEHSLVSVPADPTVGVGRARSLEERKADKTTPVKTINITDPNNTIDGGSQLSHKHQQPPTQATNAQMKIKDQARNYFFNKPDEGSGGGGQPAVIDADAERRKGEAEYKGRCKQIRDFVKAVANPKWKEKAEKLAEKHIDGDANYRDFFAECTREFTTEVQIVNEPDPNAGQQGGNRSMGQMFVASRQYKGALESREQGKRNASLQTDIAIMGSRSGTLQHMRAGFNSGDLSAINVAPQNGLVSLGTQRLTIMDLISPGTTSAAAIPYPRENTLGVIDGVAVGANLMPRIGTTGERGQKPRWEPDLTTETATVKKIAVLTSVPDEFMADFPGMASFIDERLPYMVNIETEFQLLYGDGVGNNIRGILATAGVQTRGWATSWADSIKKAITDIRTYSFFEPDGIVMHPFDWEIASLEKDLNGQYIAGGGPTYVNTANGGMWIDRYTYWGKPVVITTSCTVGQPVVGCFKLGAQYFIREGMRIETTNANKDDFEKNLVTLRAEQRLAEAIYRPVAFLEFSGLNSPVRT